MARRGRPDRATEPSSRPRRSRSASTRPDSDGPTPWYLSRTAKASLFTVLGVVTVSVLFALAAVPVRGVLDLRHTSAVAERRLAELDAANAEAEAIAAALQSDTEIERMAREQFGYARAGEEVYHLLPEARDPVRVPDAWPFNGLGAAIQR